MGVRVQVPLAVLYVIERREIKLMNDEIKEILIDLVDYYNAIGSQNDPGIKYFENVVQRASDALREHAKKAKKSTRDRSSVDVDPFADTGEFELPDLDFGFKQEDEW